jgi:hypothetical protein
MVAELSQLKIPKFNTLGACNTCTQIKNHQESFKKNSLEWTNLHWELLQYLQQVQSERVAQQTRDNTAITFPHIQWTITTNFMQDLFLLWIINKPKGWYVPNLHQIFLTSRLKKKFLPLKMFGLLNYTLYIKFIFLILSNSHLQNLCCLSTLLEAQCQCSYLLVAAQLDLGVPSPHSGLTWHLPVHSRAIAKLWVPTFSLMLHRHSKVRGQCLTRKLLNSREMLGKYLKSLTNLPCWLYLDKG